MSLEIDDLALQYAGTAAGLRPALQDVRLALAEGEIGVLIGPSGCGKTSVLRSIAGLERPSRGRIEVHGRTLFDAAGGVDCPAERRQVGMVFQDFALFPHLDVRRNVAFGLQGLARDERDRRVDEVLALVGLAEHQRRMPHQLSGGQQQRVALARALAPRPRLLLLDEPFSSLDVELRERLAHEVRGILKAAGTTALFVTHDQLEAFEIGDRVGVMRAGRLEQWDTGHALYHRPATRFVADFIGHGVFAPARRLGTGPALTLQTPLGTITDPEGRLDAPGADDACEVLLRADDIVHDDDSPVKACVERKSFRGSAFLYTLRLADGLRVMAHVPSHHDHAIGEWIGIRADVEHLVAFARAPQPSV